MNDAVKRADRRSRGLCCLALALLIAALWTGAAQAETVQTSLASGNLSVPLAVDPVENTEGYSAILYDNRNGLPTSEANAIAQTSEGFIWIGSYAGLIRYDGNTFERIETTEGILNTRCLYVDSQDRLWIGTNDFGVYVMTRGEFHRVDQEGQLVSISIRAITEAPDGLMYIATAAGAATVDAELNLTVVEDERISGEMIHDLRLGSDGLVWAITQKGDLFTMRDGKVQTYLPEEEMRPESILSLLPDPAMPGSIYYAAQNSSHVQHGALVNGTLVSDGDWDISPLSGVESMEYIDGQLWICAGNGIGRLSGGKFGVLENAPMDKMVGRMLTDYEGNLWFTSTRQCVMKIVPNRFLDLFEIADLTEEIVNSTCLSGSRLFVGTDSGLIVIEDGQTLDSLPLTSAATASGEALNATDLVAFLKGVRIRSIIRDSQERLWISTWGQYGQLRYDQGALTAFTLADGMISTQARTVCECSDGSILVAQPDGISVIQGDSVVRQYGAQDGLAVTGILTVTEGFRQEMILGSDGGGIYVITPDGVRHIGIGDGLKSEVILRIKRSRYQELYWIATGNSLAYMTPDFQVTTIERFPYSNNYDLYENSDGDVWVLSSNGVYVASVEDLMANGQVDAVFYGIPSGLPYIATSNSFSELNEQGDLYIAGVKGVTRVNIGRAFDSVSELKIALPYVDMDGQRVYADETGGYTVPFDVRKVTLYPYVFSYSLIDPQVSYRLEGFDTEDVTVSRGELAAVTYTNLPQGEFRFVIQVKDPAGNGSVSVSFPIVKEKALSDGASGTIIIDVASLFFLFGILIYTALYRKRGRIDDRLFWSLIVINIVMAVAEITFLIMQASQTYDLQVPMYANFMLIYLAVAVFPYLAVLFLDYRLHQEVERLKKIQLLYAIPLVCVVILLILNLFNGWIFSVAAGNVYHGGPLELIVYIPVVFYGAVVLIKAFRIDPRLVPMGVLMMAARVVWYIWFKDISSTVMIYTLFLICTHIHVMNRSILEEMP